LKKLLTAGGDRGRILHLNFEPSSSMRSKDGRGPLREADMYCSNQRSPLCAAKSGRSLGPVDCGHEFNNLTNRRQERLLQQAFANLAKRARVTAAGEAMR
jgi:hypothetical protein